MTTIAAPHCDCSECRAKHWADAAFPATANDEPLAGFTTHDVIDAWRSGCAEGSRRTVRRLITTLTTWLTTDPDEPVTDEGLAEPIPEAQR